MDCSTLRGELVEVLYGEASPESIRRLEEHCGACPACRDELAGFREVRQDLAAWRLPESTIRPGLRHRAAAWPLAAAAALLVALGGTVGYAAAQARFSSMMAARDARVRQEIESVRAEVRAIPARDDQVLMARVDERIRQAEMRQGLAFQTRLADLADRTETQRRYDLARMSAGLSYLDGRTGQSMARATQLMGYVLQASEKR